MEGLKVAIVTPEFYGYNMVGGLGMASYGLARALEKKGVDIRVITPISGAPPDPQPREGFPVHTIPGFGLHQSYANWEKLFFDSFRFAKRIADELKGIENNYGWAPDIIHLHEWQTCAASYELKKTEKFSGTPILLTVHNAYYEGMVPVLRKGRTILEDFPEAKAMITDALLADGELFSSLLEMGVYFADAVNTVSPTYAKEILDGSANVSSRVAIRMRENGLVGILNGIDDELMNPGIDAYIEQFSPHDLEQVAYGKGLNKLRLSEYLREKGYTIEPNTKSMWVSMMSRLVDQKGIDAVLRAAEEIKVEGEIQLFIVGKPMDYETREKIRSMNESPVIGYADFAKPELQHLILAASDAILMPSVEEPCGLVQLEGMRYGAIPITTQVGGLKDTVVPYEQEGGYGFVIDDPTKEGVIEAIKRAKGAFQDKSIWVKALANALRQNFAWDGPNDSVGRYITLYKRLLEH